MYLYVYMYVYICICICVCTFIYVIHINHTQIAVRMNRDSVIFEILPLTVFSTQFFACISVTV